MSAMDPVHAFLRRPEVRRRLHRVRWGGLRRTEPISSRWGYDRGTPIDRYYIDRFVDAHASDIRGDALEVKDTRYTSTRGSASRLDVLDVDPDNPAATLVVDLAVPESLPPAAFDCAVITQTLMYVDDPIAAVANLWRSLRPGGCLLLTVAAIANVDPDSLATDRWRFTPRGVSHLIQAGCPGAGAAVEGHGNPLVAVAFLHGVAAEELRSQELDRTDLRYPVVVTARVTKPA